MIGCKEKCVAIGKVDDKMFDVGPFSKARTNRRQLEHMRSCAQVADTVL